MPSNRALVHVFSLTLAGAFALAACQSSSTGTVTVGPVTWTAVAAADVEVNAALAAVSWLKQVEVQLPLAKASLQASGQAMAGAVLGQANAMVAGASPAIQGQQAAISAIETALPGISALIPTKQSGSGSAVESVEDLITFLGSEGSYLVPSVLAANTGTITATQLASDESALQAAAAGL